jgi:hypothetical protein
MFTKNILEISKLNAPGHICLCYLAHNKGKPPIMIVTWNLADKCALFARALVQEVNYRLVAEQLPRSNRWDWSVWRQADQVMDVRHGRANSGINARGAAESAVRDWSEQ